MIEELRPLASGFRLYRLFNGRLVVVFQFGLRFSPFFLRAAPSHACVMPAFLAP